MNKTYTCEIDCDCDICAERNDFCDCITPGKPCPYHNPDPDAEPELIVRWR